MFFEAHVVSQIQQLIIVSPMWIEIAIFFARWFIFVYIILAFVLWRARKTSSRHAVFEAAWAALMSILITTLIALFIHRARPFLAPFDPAFPITHFIPPPFNTSFPSGHTAVSTAIAAAMFYVNRRVGILAFVCAALIAFSRVAVGVHYPSDLLGGIAVGLLSFALVRFMHRQLRTKDLNQAAKQYRHE